LQGPQSAELLNVIRLAGYTVYHEFGANPHSLLVPDVAGSLKPMCSIVQHLVLILELSVKFVTTSVRQPLQAWKEFLGHASV
jgi:hypothetical protein